MPLEGDRVRLREERPEDMPHLVVLRNDLDTQAWSKTLPPDYTLPMYMARFEERKFSFDRFDARFIIEDKASGEFAGIIVYSHLQPRFAVTIGIMVAKPFWSAGVGFDAQDVLLRFLFLELGVQVVRVFTHSGNPRAVRLAQRSGFQVSSRVREAVYKSGERFDNLNLDLLREEYFALHPELQDHFPPITALKTFEPSNGKKN